MDLFDGRIAKPVILSELWVNQQGNAIVNTIFVNELVYFVLSHHIIYLRLPDDAKVSDGHNSRTLEADVCVDLTSYQHRA